ncbi:maleylacetoacetate isomerase [Thalassotalea sp. LPB0316]|uniref:maleylacetoacetate isomerase n=1 Tax=Thalassotalea sp. LPB0316 TaxID=2769490 RepID=UPI00186898E4|nr:maleylacetoacetate isomerase [Thalassotalea sp. LPB0316]QOL27148.1 maleylacetoacetate isomerase [Thalassotalea sp. LPB0316]
MKLYGYWRSSAAYRVRIALNLLSIDCELLSVHLLKNGGEQHFDEYKQKNPHELVPCLVDGEVCLNQSLAIIDYLVAKAPSVALLPNDIAQQCQVKAFAYDIACEIHPLNNLRVQQYLANELKVTEEQKMQWVHDWMHTGFKAIEIKLQTHAGKYCFGDEITLADLCLIPQVYNALRFKVDMANYPLIMSVYQQCNTHPAFIKAQPENQADAQ